MHVSCTFCFMHVSCMVYLSHTFYTFMRVLCMFHAWNTLSCMFHEWKMHGSSFHAWNMHESIFCAWNILKHAWKTHESSFHAWNVLKHACFRRSILSRDESNFLMSNLVFWPILHAHVKLCPDQVLPNPHKLLIVCIKGAETTRIVQRSPQSWAT